MTEPVWIASSVALALHREQLAEHGGGDGIRDIGLLESALERPRNLFAYGDVPDLFELAASYAYGVAKNHPFIDGNKRASFVISLAFLSLNGFEIDADEADMLRTWLALASGDLAEGNMAGWLRRHASSGID